MQGQTLQLEAEDTGKMVSEDPKARMVKRAAVPSGN